MLNLIAFSLGVFFFLLLRELAVLIVFILIKNRTMTAIEILIIGILLVLLIFAYAIGEILNTVKTILKELIKLKNMNK